MASTAPSARPTSRKLLSENLIVERARAGLSQTALAEATGVTRQTISEIERAATNATVDLLDKISDALDIPIEQLFVDHISGLVGEDELARRLASGRQDAIDARALLDAVDEAAGRTSRRYSSAGRPRMGR